MDRPSRREPLAAGLISTSPRNVRSVHPSMLSHSSFYQLLQPLVHCSRSIGEDAVHSDNHTVRLDICESEQHGFVGQVLSGPVVGIRPTRRPLRLSCHVPAHG